MRSRLSTIAVIVLGAAMLTSVGSSAPATFPGPNGKMVFGGLSSVRLLNPDGSGSTVVAAQGGTAPVWSADGRWIAYSSNRDPWSLRVMRSDGSQDREVLGVGGGNSPMHNAFAWSPSGAEIAYQCSAGLCAVRVADGATRQVLQLQLATAEAIRPAWAPDGSRLALSCRYQFRPALCLVRTDGSDPLVYFPPAGVSVSFPDWSPDGTRILTSGGTVIDVDDGEVRDVTTLDGRGRWSPDGRSIAVWSSGAGTTVVPLDGGAPVKVADAMLSDWGTSPAVTVSASQLESKWVFSRQTGSVQLRGTASHGSMLSVALRVAGRTYPPASISVPAGDYAVSTPLPRDLLPGALEILVGGTSGSEPLLTVVRAETLPVPATGLVARSWVSLTPRGVPTACVRWARTEPFYANFAFSVRPAAKRLRAVWISPSGVELSSPRVASARVVSVRQIAASLGRGRWRCRLEVGRTPLAIATVRVGC